MALRSRRSVSCLVVRPSALFRTLLLVLDVLCADRQGEGAALSLVKRTCAVSSSTCVADVLGKSCALGLVPAGILAR